MASGRSANDVLVRQHGLSDRQALALDHVFGQGRLTIADFAALYPGVNRRTPQRDLKYLVEKGLLVEAGSGPTDPTRYYRLSDSVSGSEKEL